MTETVKKRKRSDCSTQVEENSTESAPQGDNLNKELAVAKRNRYTFEEKKKILEECKTLNSRELCVKYGLNKSVLSKWRSNEEIIKNAAKTSHTKTLKKVSEINELDAELFTWLFDCRCKGIPVSGPMLCRQALVINSRIGGPENFKASHGWLEKWKRRTHIKNVKITGHEICRRLQSGQSEGYAEDFSQDNPKMQMIEKKIPPSTSVAQHDNMSMTEEKPPQHHSTNVEQSTSSSASDPQHDEPEPFAQRLQTALQTPEDNSPDNTTPKKDLQGPGTGKPRKKGRAEYHRNYRRRKKAVEELKRAFQGEKHWIAIQSDVQPGNTPPAPQWIIVQDDINNSNTPPAPQWIVVQADMHNNSNTPPAPQWIVAQADGLSSNAPPAPQWIVVQTDNSNTSVTPQPMYVQAAVNHTSIPTTQITTNEPNRGIETSRNDTAGAENSEMPRNSSERYQESLEQDILPHETLVNYASEALTSFVHNDKTCIKDKESPRPHRIKIEPQDDPLDETLVNYPIEDPISVQHEYAWINNEEPPQQHSIKIEPQDDPLDTTLVNYTSEPLRSVQRDDVCVKDGEPPQPHRTQIAPPDDPLGETLVNHTSGATPSVQHDDVCVKDEEPPQLHRIEIEQPDDPLDETWANYTSRASTSVQHEYIWIKEEEQHSIKIEQDDPLNETLVNCTIGASTSVQHDDMYLKDGEPPQQHSIEIEQLCTRLPETDAQNHELRPSTASR